MRGDADQPLPALFRDTEKLTVKDIPNLYDYAVGTPSNQKVEIKYATVGPEEAARLKEVTGFDLSGCNHSVDNFAIRHINNQHGVPASEESRGQLAITRDDIAKIPEIVANPDKVTALKTRQNRDGVGYTKRFDGDIFYVEEIRTGKKLLSAVSMRKLKAGATNAPPSLESRSATSETVPGQDVDNIASQIESGKPSDVLEQQGGALAAWVGKGATRFLEDGKAILHLFETAGSSTRVRELAHILRRQLRPEDLAVSEKWAGVNSSQWDMRSEKKFARGFAKYCTEGIASSAKIRRIFQKMQTWMLDIYESLNEQGDYDKLTDTPEFKNWFGESKVVFKKGEFDPCYNPGGIPGVPRLVYHNVDRDSVDLCQPDKRGVMLFSSSPDMGLEKSERAMSVPVYLKIENPLEIRSSNGAYVIDAALIEKARAQGNDGIIVDFYGYFYVVFSPEQVKSPIKRRIFNQGGVDLSKGQSCSGAVDTTLAKAFKQIEKRPVEIIGLPVTGPDDLAVLAQGWRNPNYEEMRYVFIKDGIIIDHEGVTCRLPMMSRTYIGNQSEREKHIKERIAALNADSLYLVHNHPSGIVDASDEDRKLTLITAKKFPEMKGHIIINSKRYGFIDLNGRCLPHPLPAIPNEWIDPILTDSVPHVILSGDLGSRGKIAGWAKALTVDRNKPLIIYFTSRSQVRGLQEINPGGSRDWRQLADSMPKKLVDFGSSYAVLILPERSRGYVLEIGRWLAGEGVFHDVYSVDEDGAHAVVETGVAVPKDRFGGRPLSDFLPEPLK